MFFVDRLGKPGGKKMGRFLDYFNDGKWYLIKSVIPAMICYLFFLGILLFVKKDKNYFKQNMVQLMLKYLWIVYFFAILNITGVVFTVYHLDWFADGISMINVGIPFVEASFLMVLLNTILFIPYGIFSSISFKWLNWKRAFFLGAGTSLCIEFLQLFTGRLFELDDLLANTLGTMCGYFLGKSVVNLPKKKFRKNAICTMGITMLCSILYLIGISQIATGDTIQAEYDAQFHEIGSSEDELSAIEEMVIYKEKKILKLSGIKDNEWYIYNLLATDISNDTSRYMESVETGNLDEIPLRSDSEFMKISYQSPQSFNFSNNDKLEMKDAVTILYNMENGTLYYETMNSGSYVKWTPDESKYPFIRDELLKSVLFDNE